MTMLERWREKRAEIERVIQLFIGLEMDHSITWNTVAKPRDKIYEFYGIDRKALEEERQALHNPPMGQLCSLCLHGVNCKDLWICPCGAGNCSHIHECPCCHTLRRTLTAEGHPNGRPDDRRQYLAAVRAATQPKGKHHG